MIEQIVRDETWLESERLGRQVAPDDRVVLDNVCRVILRVGQRLRDSVEQELAQLRTISPGRSVESLSPADFLRRTKSKVAGLPRDSAASRHRQQISHEKPPS
jgi:hypothetical protein